MNRFRRQSVGEEPEPELNPPAPVAQISLASVYEYLKVIDGKLENITESVNLLTEATRSRKRKSIEVWSS